MLEKFSVSIRTVGGLGEIKLVRGDHVVYSGPIGSPEASDLFEKLFNRCLFSIEDSRGELFYLD